MGFLDYLYITVFVILILSIVYDLILIAVNSQRIKKISRKAAVKMSIKSNVIWIILSALNVYLDFDQYRTALKKNDDTETRLRLLALIAWILCGITYIAMIFINRYIYITPDGLLYKSMIKIRPKENYRYRINDDTLELYYKQNDTPVKYRITGDKEELVKMLDENYVPFIEV